MLRKTTAACRGELKRARTLLLFDFFLTLVEIEARHVLVSFLEEEGNPTAILPAKRVICDNDDLKEGVTCSVEWTDKKFYPAKVLATGMYNFISCGYRVTHVALLSQTFQQEKRST